ncbi:MAG: hypothetical protein M1836_007231 [Candelina mexicana]|nr:MAG: hypothetical protein M1836_007231 [Candelina mexicana]
MVQPDKFPFLSEAEFGFASRLFVEKFEEVGWNPQAGDWERLGLRREREQNYILIRRNLGLSDTSKESEAIPATLSLHGELDIATKDQDDLDHEALQRSYVSPAKPYVEYHILLSPTYRVPVLYFFLRKTSLKSQADLDAVYKFLVPPQLKTEVLNTGPIGGITMGEHPIFDMPAFHVHPCNTAAAMEDLGGAQGISLQNYLQIWIGLVGGHVGLSLPLSSP